MAESGEIGEGADKVSWKKVGSGWAGMFWGQQESRVFSPAAINQQHVEAAVEAAQKEVSKAQRGL